METESGAERRLEETETDKAERQRECKAGPRENDLSRITKELQPMR